MAEANATNALLSWNTTVLEHTDLAHEQVRVFSGGPVGAESPHEAEGSPIRFVIVRTTADAILPCLDDACGGSWSGSAGRALPPVTI